MSHRIAKTLTVVSTFGLALVLGSACTVSDSGLTFVPDNQVRQGAGGGTAGSSDLGGAGGTEAATGGAAGVSGSGGKAGAGPCGACLGNKCATAVDLCAKHPLCAECLVNPLKPACAGLPDLSAVEDCACKDCPVQCAALATKCGSAGAGGVGGAGGAGGAAGASGGGAGGGPPTYASCEPCISAQCQTALIACNGDPTCAPCINGGAGQQCNANVNYQKVILCSCTSDCGALCKCSAVFCGNGKIDGTEDCEGTNLQGKTCATVLGDPAAFGQLSCSGECHYDVSSCVSQKPFCGDKKANQASEACDIPDFKMQTCATLLANPMATGLLGCTYKCGLDATKCMVPAVCGDGIITAPEEQCDGQKLGGATCVTLLGAGASGTLKCDPTCHFDASLCKAGPLCGNGKIDPGEQCDTNNLNSFDCKKFTNDPFAVGALKCHPNCTFDGSACAIPTAVCGNGIKEKGEQCDKTDLGSADCKIATGIPNEIGTLACKSDCTFDTASCMMAAATCGDGTINQPSEECDGTDLGGKGCVDFLENPAAKGTLLCNTSTCKLNGSGCTLPLGVCGDGVIDQTSESCDVTSAGASVFPPGVTCAAWKEDKLASGNVSCGSCDAGDGSCASMNHFCGNNIREGGEECDGPSGLPSCQQALEDPGATMGTVTCTPSCKLNISACSTPCGFCTSNLCTTGVSTCNTTTMKCATPVPPVVDDGDPCTFDYCDPVSGVVAHLPKGDCCPHSLCGPFTTPATKINVVGCSYGAPGLLSPEDACVETICKKDPYCCNTLWDNVCQGHLTNPMDPNYCGKTYTCGCAHPLCSLGGPLSDTCDPCVEAICAQSPQCCTGAWDLSCVEQLQTVCRLPLGYCN